MKVILSRLPILFLMLYYMSYSVEFSEDSVKLDFKIPVPAINLVNDSNYEIAIDYLKIKLIEGEIFKEMFFLFSVDSFYIENENICQSELLEKFGTTFHYSTKKEINSTFSLEFIKGRNTNIIMPPRSRSKDTAN